MRRPVMYPNPVLREPTDVMDPETIRAHGDGSSQGDMAFEVRQLLTSHGSGLALAANQAGQPWRYFVVDRERADSDLEGRLLPTVVCNPTIVVGSPEMSWELEGCLSFPGFQFRVRRHDWVDVSFAYTSDVDEGVPGRRVHTVHEMRLTGLWARVFQHEVEHLDGKTFIDFLPRRKRAELAASLTRKGATGAGTSRG